MLFYRVRKICPKSGIELINNAYLDLPFSCLNYLFDCFRVAWKK